MSTDGESASAERLCAAANAGELTAEERIGRALFCVFCQPAWRVPTELLNGTLLLQHLRRVHLAQYAPYVCAACGERFAVLRTAQGHFRCHHADERSQADGISFEPDDYRQRMSVEMFRSCVDGSDELADPSPVLTTLQPINVSFDSVSTWTNGNGAQATVHEDVCEPAEYPTSSTAPSAVTSNAETAAKRRAVGAPPSGRGAKGRRLTSVLMDERTPLLKAAVDALIRRHPTSTRVLPCLRCGKHISKHHRVLTSHIWEHSGEQPFVCCACGQAEVHSMLVIAHLREVHADLGKWVDQYTDRRDQYDAQVAAFVDQLFH